MDRLPDELDHAGLDLVATLLQALGLQDHATDPGWRAWFILCLFLLAGGFVDFALRLVQRKLTRRTATDLDDRVVAAVRSPAVISVVLLGAWLSLLNLAVGDGLRRVAGSLLASVVLVAWTRALLRISGTVLEALARRTPRNILVEQRTMPLFEMTAKVLIVGGSIYALMLAWDIDVTAWLASAGVLGIAVGFAAQETLSNMLAGVMIIADAPYRIGDFLVLDGTTRGRVTDIGLRSTRLLTEHNIEIVVPNRQMAGATITNESGGGSPRSRVRVDASVAYGSDVDHVRAVLLDIARGIPGVLADQPGFEPEVRFRAMGESSLDFEVLAWIDRPEHRLAAIDRLNTAIYKGLVAEGLEIPYPKRDVYLYDMGRRKP